MGIGNLICSSRRVPAGGHMPVGSPLVRGYADRYVEFDVLEVARRCGAQVLKKVQGGHYLARCPFCGDSANPNRGHLYIKHSSGLWYCQRCHRGGNALQFYAEARGLGRDLKAAYKQLLQEAGCAPQVVFDPRRVEKEPEENPVAPVERRHEVYSAMLRMLPLYPLHLEDLKRRGLTEEVIERNGYRSYPAVSGLRRSVAAALAARFNLAGVPGFYLDREKGWSIVHYPDGYFVPVRDCAGRIQGLQIRVLPFDPAKHSGKYTWFSSAGRECGAKASQWLHLALPPGVEVAGRVWLTEGALKADVASHYLKVPFVASPGNCRVKDLLSVLESLGVEEVVMAYDADRYRNDNVRREVDKLDTGMSVAGIHVEPAVWPVKIVEGRGLVPKGIDDACLLRARRSLPLSEEVFLAVTESRTKKVTVESGGGCESLTVEETVTRKYEGRGVLKWLTRLLLGQEN